MKAMVLAAGVGLRMRPLSLLRAKSALPVLNRPLLHWTLERLARHGVDDVVINLHHRPETVTQAVGDGRRFGLRVRYSRERRILGTAGGPRQVRDFFADEPFLLVNGDVVFDFDLTQLVRRHRTSGARATLALKPNPDSRRYRPVVTAHDGRVRSLAGLPRRARGPVSLFTGVHVLDPALLERLPPGFSDSVRDLYAPLIAEGETVLGCRVRGAWHDLGSPSLYLGSQLYLLAARPNGSRSRALIHRDARVRPGARVSRSVVGRRAVVEAGAVVAGSVLWEDVRVGRGAVVRGCVVTDRVTIPAGARLVGQCVLRGGGGRGLVCEGLKA
jgi:NDP-sugar pyrophosphorylase family protein